LLEHERARPHLAKAFGLSHRLTDKDRLQIAAWYAVASDDEPAAIRAYQQLVRAHPGEVEAHARLVALLESQDRPGEALEVALRGLERDPENADLYNQLSGVYNNLGRLPEGLAAARRYVELSPGEPNALDTLGLAFQAAGRYEEAIAAYREALRKKPDFEMVNLHLGNTYAALGRYREAMEQFRRFGELSGTDHGSRRAHASLAFVHLARRELAEAAREAALGFDRTAVIVALARHDLAEARRIASAMPAETHREALFPRASLALREGEPERALALLREMLKHRAPLWTIQTSEDELANALLSLKRHDEAIAEYRRVLAMNPRFPLARYRLGLALEGKGERELARQAYRQFLLDWKDADPGLAEPADARRRLGL
jgi:tetratricopeptide (TPR) repeat protein